MKNKILPILLATSLVLGACGNGSDNNTGDNSNNNSDKENSDNSNNNSLSGNSSNSDPVDTDFSQTEDDMFSNRDADASYNVNDSVTITLNGSSATCDSNKVQISGSTITITDEGTYIISGTLSDGMIIVNAEESDKPQIVLNNANITNETCAPIYILEADKVFITLADGSTNTLTNGGTYTPIDENNIDGVVYSKQDLTFNGNGSLTISAPVEHGIVCKDDLVFTGGTYTITSASHGIDANDSVRIKDGNLTIDAGKDGIHVENSDDTTKGFFYASGASLNIEAEGDGIDAGYYVQIEDGSFTMVCGGGYENGEQKSSGNWGNMGGGMPGGGGRPGGGRSGGTSGSSSDAVDDTDDSSATSIGTAGTSTTTATTTTTDDGSSMKGIKANSSILINGGTFNIDSADDGIHANLSAYINNGTFTIASGDDGIHSEEELTITGGTIDITESYEGIEGLNITISGGATKIKASDDGINAAGGNDSSGTTGGRDGMFGGGGWGGASGNFNGTIVVSGGSIYMYAGGDGFDSNGSLEITGGNTIVTGPTSGDTSVLDYETTGTITGGTYLGLGGYSQMAVTFSNNTQGVLAIRGSIPSGTNIIVKDSDGNEVFSYATEASYTLFMLSTPDLVSGETYNLSIGSEASDFKAN